jgi:hypothetical protein
VAMLIEAGCSASPALRLRPYASLITRATPPRSFVSHSLRRFINPATLLARSGRLCMEDIRDCAYS